MRSSTETPTTSYDVFAEYLSQMQQAGWTGRQKKDDVWVLKNPNTGEEKTIISAVFDFLHPGREASSEQEMASILGLDENRFKEIQNTGYGNRFRVPAIQRDLENIFL